MAKRHWRKDQSKDRYFRQAKQEGYRSRSAYKLLQINERFNILHRGARVVDLGAAPGGWSQVCARTVGKEGKVIACDLVEVNAMRGVRLIQGDMTTPEVRERIRQAARGPIDVVLSDAAPSTTGIRDRDHAASINLAETALLIAKELLAPGGSLVVKVFEGEYFPDYLAEVRRSFSVVKAHRPAASRSESREMFVVAQGFDPSAE
jgi:23S rRNA (uridine2552-2'-O)-methyltransferase